MDRGRAYRLAAFAVEPGGGNPAGVWVGAALPTPAEMQRIGADVGYTETAFVAPARGMERDVRYYGPRRRCDAMGRPSRLHVTIPVAGGIIVTGTAVPIEVDSAPLRARTP